MNNSIEQETLTEDNSIKTCTAVQNCNDPASNCLCNLPTAPHCLAVDSPAGAAGQCVVSWVDSRAWDAATSRTVQTAAVALRRPDPSALPACCSTSVTTMWRLTIVSGATGSNCIRAREHTLGTPIASVSQVLFD